MKTIKINSEMKLDFEAARSLGDSIARNLLEGSTCLSWYDKIRDHENPAGVSECHDVCDIPGYVEYAETRGAQLKLDFDEGTFVFCHISVDDFFESGSTHST